MRRDIAPLMKRAAIGFFGLCFVAAIASGLHRTSQFGEQTAPAETKPTIEDPISAELKRCSGLTNEKAMSDKKCRRAWILNRQRFFGQHHKPNEEEE